jgi:hypothetical protein
LVFLDLRVGTFSQLQLPFEIVHDVHFSVDGKRLAISGSGSGQPVDIWVLGLKGKGGQNRLRKVTHSPHPGLNLDLLVRPESRRFTATRSPRRLRNRGE